MVKTPYQQPTGFFKKPSGNATNLNKMCTVIIVDTNLYLSILVVIAPLPLVHVNRFLHDFSDFSYRTTNIYCTEQYKS